VYPAVRLGLDMKMDIDKGTMSSVVIHLVTDRDPYAGRPAVHMTDGPDGGVTASLMRPGETELDQVWPRHGSSE
jgi:hypothetical protein